ncbi:sensor histidine kinase [Rubrivirga marina]|uniref:histidine kinase n=1 Tax=Rubrivirga marina TaxID=1196024 RepID=A0A271IW31_9BACT|nr:ATP-binding protein [Rubrivirga marina]PAP75446.1 hypothetical protein BSZ37_02790 [Rubrivirga marina]
MSDGTPPIATLEKTLRQLQRKLERSEWHRVDLENQHDRDQHLYRRLQADLEAAQREAQIQLALERIRTQTSLMEHSSELVATSAVFHEQLLALGVPTEFSYVWLPDEAAGQHQFWATWTADEDGETVHRSKAITYGLDKEEPYTAACFAAWESDERFLVDFVPPADIAHVFEIWDELIGNAEHLSPERFSDGIFYAEGYMAYGCFGVNIRREPAAEEQAILRRFALEFERAYTRFLDLQKAEAQARESQIEAALERIRSRTMGMRSSDELSDVIGRMFSVLTHLDLDLTGCVIWVIDPETRSARFWMANAERPDEPDSYHIPYHDHPSYRAFLDAWDRREALWTYDLHGELKATWDAVLFSETELRRLPDEVKAGMAAPDRVLLTASFTPFGALHVASLEPLADESAAILRRVATVFDQAYTRYLDLEQAEARAREAQIEVAMERVRSRALAMITSDELLDVAFTIRREFAGLGLECGAFWHTRYTPEVYQKALTSLDGKKLAAVMELPRDFASNPALAAWEHGDEKVGVFPFDAEAGAEYMHHMATKGKFSEIDPEAITVEMVREHGGITFVQARTSHGEIGYSLWGEAEPTEEAKDVLVRFTTAFDLAYRRFEDLQQAEADHQALLEEKALTERALDELRATQAQLVQAEKMASLGALTAGIAHEIKNPLNFVNNFAALSQELVEELTNETDPEERATLLADLQANAAKIEEHGRRADAIVRSMMEHARSGSGERHVVDLNALVAEYARHAEHAVRVRHPGFEARLSLHLGDGVGEVELAPQEIGRVLINLIDNALDATRQRAEAEGDGYAPTVTVATCRTVGSVEVRVGDNGPGMAEAVRARVFEPFFTTKPTGEGTGLGLSLSHDIVAQGHGGTLAVESAEGMGATFVLTLPTGDRP